MKTTSQVFLFFIIATGMFAQTLEPFSAEPKLSLNAEQQEKVAKGELVYWDKAEDLPGKKYLREGSAIFRVDATPEAVWRVLKDFENYPDWAYKVGATKTYEGSDKSKEYVDFKTQLISKHYFVEHDFPKPDSKGELSKLYGTWKTDHSKKNDCVLDTVGFWRVEPVKDQPKKSDIFYSGKVILTKTCAKGFLGIGGFNSEDMAKQTFKNLKKRV